MCVSVPEDLANRGTDMIIFYKEVTITLPREIAPRKIPQKNFFYVFFFKTTIESVGDRFLPNFKGPKRTSRGVAASKIYCSKMTSDEMARLTSVITAGLHGQKAYSVQV